jgi:cubilin
VFTLIPNQICNISALCGGRLEADFGRIESPGYPDEYLSSQDCTWDIVVPSGYTVAIKFELFRLESHDDCIYDHLQV